MNLLTAHAIDLFARHSAAGLISSLWEGVLLAAFVGLCLQVIPGATAKLRFIVWTIAFAVLAVLPVLHAFLAGRASTAQTPIAAPHLQLDARWSYALAAVWLAAVVVRFGHLVLQAVKLRLLWKSAVPVSVELLPEISLGRVQLCISAELDRPSVIGFFLPRILIPAWLFNQLTPGELHQIVLHELEHLRRRDDWANLIQKIGLVLFPLNPALFWIDRRLAMERELACDDGVLGRTNAPRAYATCLTSLAERRLEHCRGRFTVLALGAMGAVRRSDFSRRIESILKFGWRSTLNPAPARTLTACLIAALFGGAAALTHAPQFVSFTDAAQPEAIQAFTESAPGGSTNRRPSSARFEDVVFHQPQAQPLPVAGKSNGLRSVRRKIRHRLSASEVRFQAIESKDVPTQRRFWTVFTSWHRSASQPVLVTLPDGRTFLATYAVDPNATTNQADWLIIQL